MDDDEGKDEDQDDGNDDDILLKIEKILMTPLGPSTRKSFEKKVPPLEITDHCHTMYIASSSLS